jgi:hypothetical protein
LLCARVLACAGSGPVAQAAYQTHFFGDKQLKHYLALGAVVGLLTSTTAWADTFERYGEVEGWKVFIDNEKKSCLIEAVDDAENVVQMGLTEDRGVGYVGVFTKADTDIKRGETQEVAILIGDNIYLGEATGMKGNITKGYSGGYVLSDNPQFADDLAKKKVMIVFPETSYAFTVDLTGTYKAMEMARKCNEEQLS